MAVPIVSEDDITRLLNLFYGRVHKDPFLSPVFIEKIGDSDAAWAFHIQHIANFWSSIFLKTKRFNGNPMLKHIALPGITPHHFERWLEMFETAAKETLTAPQAEEITAMAHRIAKSLQMGLAFHHEQSGEVSHPFSDYSPMTRRIKRQGQTEGPSL